jgi:hypothetical protein
VARLDRAFANIRPAPVLSEAAAMVDFARDSDLVVSTPSAGRARSHPQPPR